jgi:adenylate cyclase
MTADVMKVERRLAAIFAADVAGYARLMAADEIGTVRALESHRQLMDSAIAEHGGRIANTAGDSVLAEFPSVYAAVDCAVQIQNALSRLNDGIPPDQALRFRIGVHMGDVLVRGGDILGDGVNIAARLQAMAVPAGICISEEVHDHVRKSMPLQFVDLGPQQVKNIDQPIKAYAIRPSSPNAEIARSRVRPLADMPTLAILPFENLSGDPGQDYFTEGMVDDLITNLYRVKWLVVIARSSSFAYKGKALDVKQVGQELGVRYVLTGSVRKYGDRIRISVQLLDTGSGAHAWSGRFEGTLTQIFDLQDQVSASVAGAVEPNIRLAEVQRARAKPTDRLHAYDLFLRALPLHYTNNRERLAEAQRLLAHAIEIDPDYAVAKAFSALTTVIETNQGWTSPSGQEAGIRLAREAIADHGDDPVVLRCAAHALAYLAREHDTAIALIDRALGLHPHSAEVHHSAGWVWNFAGDGLKASGHFERAMRLSPLDPEIGHSLMGLTFAQLLMGHYDDSLASGRAAIAAMPTSLSPLRARIVALVQLGRVDEARAAGRAVLDLNPSFRVGAFRRVQPFADQTFVDCYMSALLVAGIPE